MTEFNHDWNDPWTVRYYEAFSERHGRYQQANRQLVEKAVLESGQRILDLAAGTGRTAESALPFIGPTGQILCVEPARAMRQRGQSRLSDSRITWSADLPQSGQFDRILCGAAIWQLAPLAEQIQKLVQYLPTGGALCFNIPALYLGQPDGPGGGEDPLLLRMQELLSDPPTLNRGDWEGGQDRLTEAAVERALMRAGLHPKRYAFRHRLTQVEYRDWLKIPVLTNRMMPGLRAQERAERIDRAFGQCDRESWRWERWLGWTAWK